MTLDDAWLDGGESVDILLDGSFWAGGNATVQVFAAVPEPGAMMPFGAGIGVVGIATRRRARGSARRAGPVHGARARARRLAPRAATLHDRVVTAPGRSL